MTIQDLGQKVKDKYQQYVQYPVEELGRKVIEKYPEYKSKLDQSIQVMNDIGERYGQQEKMGYLLTGGSGNVAGKVKDFLQAKNLPGQTLAQTFSNLRTSDPQYQTNVKMSMGAPISETEKQGTRDSALQFAVGTTEPLNMPGFKGLNSAIGSKFSYKKANNISKEHSLIEDKFGQYLEKNIDEAKKIYREKFGNVINTDNARELSEDYVKDRERLSAAVHEPSSSLAKEIYKDILNEKVAPGKTKNILFTAGGTGAGKTSAIRDANLGEKSHAIYDSNMATLGSTIKKIDDTIKSGFTVDFTLVLRDPIDSFVNGAVPRSIRMGRTVPIEQHINTHVGSLDVFKELKKLYADNKKIKFKVIENNFGRDGAVLRPVDFVDDIVYNKKDIANSVSSELERLYADNQITKNLYEGFKGHTGD